MHESGMIRRLVDLALAEAERRASRLAAVHIRLGVLAGGSVEHLREHFAVELEQRGFAGIDLDVTADPDYPGGVELTGVDLVDES